VHVDEATSPAQSLRAEKCEGQDVAVVSIFLGDSDPIEAAMEQIRISS
jgi:hypothetical protein